MGFPLRAGVLVIGSGGAALRAAIAAWESAPSLRVVLATRGVLGGSGVTAKACSDRMAFHVTLPTTPPGGPDNWIYHAQDIFNIGGQVSDEPLAEILARGSAEAFRYLDSLGVPFAKRPDGTPLQFVTDGSEYPRACYTGPYTAVDIEQALVRRVKELPIGVVEGLVAVSLITRDGRVCGATFMRENPVAYHGDVRLGADGTPVVILAGAVVLGTGGPGQVFETNLFPEECTGSGTGIAIRAGAELVNMEFIQIGLSSVSTKLACSGSIMRCIPRVVNEEDHEFLLASFPGEDPAEIYALLFNKGATWPVSAEHRTCLIDVAVHREIERGHRVYLDLSRNPEGFDMSALPSNVMERYRSEIKQEVPAEVRAASPINRLREINPPVVQWFLERGIDLVRGDRIEIAPSIQHFQGGVKIGPRAETTVPGLFAAGEVAGGQHGANRPGGNALMDCQVFGRIAGLEAAREALAVMRGCEEASAPGDTAAGGDLLPMGNGLLPLPNGNLPATEARARLRRTMAMSCGVVRTQSGLKQAARELAAIREAGVGVDGHGPLYAVETDLMLDVAAAIVSSASERDESRGPHLMFERPDSPLPMPRDDSRWRKYIVVSRNGLEVRKPVRSNCEDE
ncbi:MAG: FAD-binding protein [Firmicutes bacterium]|jgi:succinate dehydrogenase / fumarate reductase flavoprotein subunit|nr:FAD-binding protein [Bacillota bacterium]